MWRKTRLLIWGKTYPEFSKKYYETVCTGAVDQETGKLTRIYPITLRYMKEPFQQYDWVDAEVLRNTEDFRPESYKINQDTIQVVGHVGTKPDEWKERRRWILGQNEFPSVEALVEAESQDHTSLGVVRPKEIRRIYVRRRSEDEKREWDEQRENALAQRDLFVDVEAKTKELRFMPIQYRAEFTCHGASCRGHDMSILEWGVYVLSRKAYAKGGAAQAEKDVIAKIRQLMDPGKRDPYFFLGNTKAHSRNFMIVGLFHPPRVSQMSLL
ncbi:MAG: hypothetical protein ACODAG_09900 [Myxococcota bacterium]